MAESALTTTLEAFFTDYNTAFRTIEGRRIAPFYHAPCLTLRGDGSFLLLRERQDIENFFQKVADTYKSDGYSDGAFSNFSATPLGGRSALATMDWELRRHDGSPIRQWRQSYNLLRTIEGWKIVLSTFHVD